MDELMLHGAGSGTVTSRKSALYEGQKRTLAKLVAGMDADARWILLVGPEGGGKTTILQALLAELRSTDAAVVVCDGFEVVEPDELVTVLRGQLRLPPPRMTFLGRGGPADDIIANRKARTNPLAVLVDNAHGLSSKSLKVLADLVSRTTAEHRGTWVVLAGPNSLEAPAVSACGKVKHVSCRPEPLTAAEVVRHVERRIRAGAESTITVPADAVGQIARYSGGIPGRIDALCDLAVSRPTVRLTNEVSVDAVEEAADRLGLGPSFEPSDDEEAEPFHREPEQVGGRWRRVVGALALIVAVLALVGLGFSYGPTLARSTQEWVTARFFQPEPPPPETPPESVRRRRQPRREAGSTVASTGRPAAARQGAERRPGTDQPEKTAAVERARPVPPPVTAQQIAALIEGAREGRPDDVARLLAAGVSPDVRDAGGVTALMQAILHGHVGAARTLIDSGAQINARDRGGITSIMLAVIYERSDALELLLDRKADVNARSGAGWTALTFAAWKGDPDLVRTLLKHGANRNVIDKQGWTPLDYATAKLRSPSTDLDASVGAPAMQQSGRHAEVIPLLQGVTRE